MSERQEVKVLAQVREGDEGFPGVDWEGLWARPLGADRYRLENVPFYAYGLALQDVVAARDAGGELVIEEVVEDSGHSTIRVMIDTDGVPSGRETERREHWRAELRARGCGSEVSNLPMLFAVDVPPEVGYQAVRDLLDQAEAAGELGFEEAKLVHPIA